jgi:hypothetical protein
MDTFLRRAVGVGLLIVVGYLFFVTVKLHRRINSNDAEYESIMDAIRNKLDGGEIG